MPRIYAFVKKMNGKINTSEVYLDNAGNIIAVIEVNMIVSKSVQKEDLRYIPYSMIENNNFLEIEKDKYVKADF